MFDCCLVMFLMDDSGDSEVALSDWAGGCIMYYMSIDCIVGFTDSPCVGLRDSPHECCPGCFRDCSLTHTYNDQLRLHTSHTIPCIISTCSLITFLISQQTFHSCMFFHRSRHFARSLGHAPIRNVCCRSRAVFRFSPVASPFNAVAQSVGTFFWLLAAFLFHSATLCPTVNRENRIHGQSYDLMLKV